jgi:hypothetical protein
MAANPSDATAGTHSFTEEEVRLLRRIADAVIPASVEFDVPGAGDEEILARILQAGAKHERAIRGALADLTESPAARAALLALGEAEFAEKLRAFASARPAFAGLVSWLVASAYYQDPRVLRSIGMEARAPFPKGHVVEPSDWTLLDPVKRRGRRYRDVPERG